MTDRPSDPPVISQADMRAGDVILSRGSTAGESEDALLDKLILALDQGDYTHSSLWDGEHVIEALTTGVSINDPLEQTLKNQVLIDVYRYSKNNQSFGGNGYPVAPLIDAARQFEGYGYNYTALVLSAILLLTCEVPRNLEERILLKILEIPIFEAFEKWRKGTHAMVCSEVIAQAFWNSETSPAHEYGLPVTLDGHRHFPDLNEIQATLQSARQNAQASPAMIQLHQLRANLADSLSGMLPQTLPAGSPSVTWIAGSPQLPAMFVTPGDLQRCADLKLVGTIPSQHHSS